MPPELIQILYQFPLLMAFIWYSERKDKQFQEYLREERAARGEQLKQLALEFRDAILERDRREREEKRAFGK